MPRALQTSGTGLQSVFLRFPASDFRATTGQHHFQTIAETIAAEHKAVAQAFSLRTYDFSTTVSVPLAQTGSLQNESSSRIHGYRCTVALGGGTVGALGI